MSRPVVRTLLSIPVFYLMSCHSGSADASNKDSVAAAAEKPALPLFKRNPETREVVKKEPVAEYKVRTTDKLNEQYFRVLLYETDKTMRYRIKMEYEGLEGEDTVKLPDLGTPPQPKLEKGSEQYACILGILDNDKQFRELKKIYVTPDHSSLKITTLKHYAVSENYRLVAQ